MSSSTKTLIHCTLSQIASNMRRSDGMKVVRTHIYDWLILMLLVVIVTLLQFIHPYYCFIGKGMMTNLEYPMKSDTVPFWAVLAYAVLLPMVIFMVMCLWRKDSYDLHHAVLVGRPRPDFFWRCFPDGKDVYDRWGNVICHGTKSVIAEGHKSFPSGHTSWSFAGLGFLALYLAGKIKAFDHKGHAAKLIVLFLPLLVASLVGISRLDDHKHHRQDVIAGGLIGITVAVFCYLQLFPPPYHAQGQRPYPSFEELESVAENVPPRQAAETQSESRLDERSSSTGCISSTPGRSSQDMESGGR
ncbi:hypothetical protein BT93_J0965 [Corymbia citriodora subsp. variegata]|nr:hypothetical protein BT93_J0965 [Corymbia citriodora subsp. variegata]